MEGWAMPDSIEHVEDGVMVPKNLQLRSRIGPVVYSFIGLVDPISGDPIVLCSDTDGVNRYAFLDGARAHPWSIMAAMGMRPRGGSEGKDGEPPWRGSSR